ncbi:MAG TPA: hypothetical protein VGP07_12170 [Polyangia bacterium]|jgi:hypothetical protein
MKSSTRTTNIAALFLLLGVGTACNVHDNTINIPNATINATANADVTAVVPAQTVPITVTVQNVYLVAPDATPPPEHINDAGYLQIYLDDVDTTPLLITADVTFSVTIPPATKPGPHNLICRFHKHDGTPTSTEVNVAINVAASVGADGGVDVVTSVDANVTTGGVGGSTTAGAGGAAGTGG